MITNRSVAPIGRHSGSVALVAGVGAKIGLGITSRLLAEGASVAAIGRDRERTLSLLSEHSSDERLLIDGAELSLEDGVAEVVDRVTAAFGRIDVLIFNAGGHFTPDVGLDALAASSWEPAITDLLRSAAVTVAAVVPVMADGGSIVTISASTPTRQRGGPAYAAGKGALDALTLSLARELHPRGIRVNGVAPGLVRLAATGGRPPVGIDRFGSPDDIAHAVAFLASHEAAWITGQILVVDGGDSVLTRTIAERRERWESGRGPATEGSS